MTAESEKASTEELEYQKLALEVSKLRAEFSGLQARTSSASGTDKKTEAEVEKLKQETASLRSERNAGWVRTATAIVGVVALIIGAIKTVAEIASTAQSIRDAQESAKRESDATASEISARAAQTRLAQEAELRLKESTRSEIDVKVLSTYLDDVLPKISGVVSYHVSESCLSRALGAGEEGNKAGIRCSGAIPAARAAQVASYFAATAMARRYPMLCGPTRAALSNNEGDQDASAALKTLGECSATKDGQ